MKLKMHTLVRQFAAEFFGTFLLVLFGDAAIAQVIISSTFYEKLLCMQIPKVQKRQ